MLATSAGQASLAEFQSTASAAGNHAAYVAKKQMLVVQRAPTQPQSVSLETTAAHCLDSPPEN
jgi:hypothetical protein